MTVTCPEGHRSEATDYCDTCGAPIGMPQGASSPGLAGSPGIGLPGAGPALPGQQASAAGSVLDLDPAGPVPTITCPHCGGVNLADALFCEACGYDFTTGAAPLGEEPEVPEESDPVLSEEVEASELDADPVLAEEVDADADELEPAGVEAGEVEADEAEEIEPVEAPAEAVEAVEPEEDEAEDASPEKARAEPPTTDGGDVPAATPASLSDAPQAHARPRHTPPSRDLADLWVVEMWVDPDWYAVQQTDEACPSAGVPDIVVVRRNVVLVGRPSGSLGVRPDVDAGADSAVSRRHAQLTSDGTRWWIEDLGSSNGTFVGVVGDPLPTEPVAPGQRVEIDRDDRIYVGAWTRLVVRQATDSEKAGQG